MDSHGSSIPRKALVAYGSETGTAQDAAEEIALLTQRLHFATRLAELNSVNLVCLERRRKSFPVRLTPSERAGSVVCCHCSYIDYRARRVAC